MSVKQPQQAAFEIRFSTTDSEALEVVEIQLDQNSQNIPDPFKKRDKIPRSSGSIEQFSNVNNNINININNNGNNTISLQPSPIVLKQRHHGELSSKKGISTNPDQVSSSLKVKSSNAVGPEADKQQRVNGIGKNERSNSLGNIINDVNSTERKNTFEDDLIIRNNKKQRSKLDEISTEKEKNNLGKVIPNHQIMDLNGKTDMVISNNKKIMSKTTPPLKNKLISSTNTITINHKDDEIKSLPKDGIATPPETPPHSPQITPTISQKPSESDHDHLNTFDKSQLITPPLSSGSTSKKFIDDLNQPSSVTRPSKVSQSSRKRRGSHSPQKSQSMLSTKRSIEMNAYQPPKKLQQPRGRRSSSVSGQSITSEQPLDSVTSIKSKGTQRSKTSPSPTTKSRIPRLSTSSRERPIIAQKVSQGSLSSQGSNKFNESKDYPLANTKIEPPRNIRLSPSRPIINTSLVTYVEVGSESPTGLSPTNHSPSNHSPSNHSPTSHLPINHSSSNNSTLQKKIISYDDVVIPTIAKKLKMKGQLPYVNHDALLGYSEEPEEITPSSENGYMDITDQVVNLFDGPKIKSHKRQSSSPDSQHRQRENSSTGHSRTASKTHYIAPRKQPLQQTNEEVPSPTNTQFENPSEHPAPHANQIRSKKGRSRREEYIISVREDDDDMYQFVEPNSSMILVPSEPSTVPTVQVDSNDQFYQEKVEEPSPVQPVVQEIEYKPILYTEVDSTPIVTSGKKKKDKKKKQKKSDDGNLDEDDYVRKSKCRCAIQ